jgi:ribosomal protein S18 acetylase RimI-like enzyme
MVGGGMHPDEARETADRDVDQLLADGLATAGHHLLVLADPAGGVRRGVLWFAVRDRSGRTSAYLYDVEIDAPFRGQGLGREAMLLFESLALEQGAEEADLAVFGGNTVALSLYESLGFRVTARLMRKALRQAPGA